MSRSVHINWDLLSAIVRLKTQPRLSLLKVADESLVTAICECALNILNGNVPVTAKLKPKLFQERSTIRRLANLEGDWKSKRKLIIKKGEKLVPLLVDIVLKNLQYDESSEKDGADISGNATEVEHSYTQ